MNSSRTENTIRNTVWGVIYRIVTLLGPFIIKTLIVNRLGLEYSGLSTLFTSILTVLNLSNLGFSSSVVFAMYRAIVDNDIERQCVLLNFYRRVYKIVGCVILALGLVLMPFLPHLINGTVPAGINLYLLFLIYLIETSMGYFLFAYNTAIFAAYQRNDIEIKISTARYLLQYTIQAAVLILWANYYAYIIVLPIMLIPTNIAYLYYARRNYPDVLCRGSIQPEEKKKLYGRVWTLFGHKLGNTFLVSIDSVIISAFLGLRTMGIYGNYYLILTAVNAVVEVVTNGAISSIGNKLCTDTEEENCRLFHTMSFGWFFLIGGAAVCMLCLYQPFIGGVWYTKEYLMSDKLMALVVLYFYTWMTRVMMLTFRDAAGLWTKDWLKPCLAMIINTVASIVMVKMTHSVAGVLVPTVFIFVFLYFPWETWVLFRHLFKRPAGGYYRRVLLYTVLNLASGALSFYVSHLLVPANTAASFLIRIPIIAVIHCGIWIGFTFKTTEFSNLRRMAKKILRRCG